MKQNFIKNNKNKLKNNYKYVRTLNKIKFKRKIVVLVLKPNLISHNLWRKKKKF